jgi:hypothetical protein
MELNLIAVLSHESMYAGIDSYTKYNIWPVFKIGVKSLLYSSMK